MLKGNQIIVDNATVEDTLIALSVREKKNYRTQVFEGYRIEVVSQKLGFERFSILLKEKPFEITEPTEVSFINLRLYVYVLNGVLMLKGEADGAEIVED